MGNSPYEAVSVDEKLAHNLQWLQAGECKEGSSKSLAHTNRTTACFQYYQFIEEQVSKQVRRGTAGAEPVTLVQAYLREMHKADIQR